MWQLHSAVLNQHETATVKSRIIQAMSFSLEKIRQYGITQLLF